MLKLLFLLLISNTLLSMEYVSLAGKKVYDVEIIVFAYDTPLPNNENYNNTNVIQIEKAIILQEKPQNLAFIKTVVQETTEELTMPIGEKSDNSQALTWFKHDSSFFKLNNLWRKLDNNPNTKPLLHKAWRQTASEFNNPVYVNLVGSEEIVDELQSDDRTPQLTDYLLKGKVALSKGRYLHFGNNLKLQRTYLKLGETKAMSFSLKERKQIKTNELHYFDNPWFGSIVKVTSYTGETNE